MSPKVAEKQVAAWLERERKITEKDSEYVLPKPRTIQRMQDFLVALLQRCDLPKPHIHMDGEVYVSWQLKKFNVCLEGMNDSGEIEWYWIRILGPGGRRFNRTIDMKDGSFKGEGAQRRRALRELAKMFPPRKSQ